MLRSFHPAVRGWFEQRFPDGPTEPQAAGWREIAGGGHALIVLTVDSAIPALVLDDISSTIGAVVGRTVDLEDR